MELRDIDVNEVEEPVESSPTETETVEDAVEETPKVAEETAQPISAEEPVKAQEEIVEAEPTAPERPKRNRAEERIRNLAQENKRLKEEMEKFASQTSPTLQGDEIAFDDLNKLINERALQAAELLMQGKQVESEYQTQVSNWAKDFEQVKAQNPFLDPESPDYDSELDATLAKLLDDGTGSGTPRVDILVSDVLKTLGRRETAVSSKAKEEGKAQATAKLAEQLAHSAITPGTKVSSSEEEMSDEDLAELRVSNPKEWLKRL